MNENESAADILDQINALTEEGMAQETPQEAPESHEAVAVEEPTAEDLQAIEDDPEMTVDDDDYQKWFDENVETKITSKIDSQVQERINPILAERDFNRAAVENKDFKELLPLLPDVYKDFPFLRAPGQIQQAVEIARTRNFGNMVNKVYSRGMEDGVKKIESARLSQSEAQKATTQGKTGLSQEQLDSMSSNELLEYMEN